MFIPNFITTMLYIPFMDQRVANLYANIMLMVVRFQLKKKNFDALISAIDSLYTFQFDSNDYPGKHKICFL